MQQAVLCCALLPSSPVRQTYAGLRRSTGRIVWNVACCRSAFVQNFDIVFLSDGTATSSEEMHAASLLNIGFAFGRVVTCAELRDELRDLGSAG